MFPARYAAVIFPVMMATTMACLMTFVVTTINTGMDAGFLARWGQAFVFSWPIAVPSVMLVAPLCKRLTALLVSPPQTENA